MTHHNPHLAESGVTIPSDSEPYNDDDREGFSAASSSPDGDHHAPVILYRPPTVWSIVRSTAINLVLPFINGMMLGFGELFAHEAAFRLGWSNTKIFPLPRRATHPVGPGMEVRDPRRQGSDLNDILALN